MVEHLLDFMLGPLRGLGRFYFEHQLIFNTLIVAVAFATSSAIKKSHSITSKAI